MKFPLEKANTTFVFLFFFLFQVVYKRTTHKMFRRRDPGGRFWLQYLFGERNKNEFKKSIIIIVKNDPKIN